MKVITNTPLVESRAKWGRRIAPFTMLFLLGGLVTNFMSVNRPELLRPTLILLALGFISAIVSSYLVNNWVREPRADQVLSQMLKKFSNDYMLFNYTGPVPHILLAPDGVYVFVVRPQDGQITVKDRKFSRKFSWRHFFRLLADEGMGSPITEAENRVKKLHKFLSAHLSEAEMPVMKPAVLFSHKEAKLTVEDPAIPVLTSSDFKAFMRQEGKNRTITGGQRKKLAGLVDLQE